MAFTKDKEALPDYYALEQPTKYRFAEIEIAHALSTLERLFRHTNNPRHYAMSLIYDNITPRGNNLPEFKEEFIRLTSSNMFANPHKDELIDYFRFRHLSYAKIRQHTGTSPNTIANRRFHPYPYYEPHFRLWSEEMLSAWHALAPTLNIFKEELIHSFY
jgi:hypothetical protein